MAKTTTPDLVEVTLHRGTYQVSTNEKFDDKGQLVSRTLVEYGPGKTFKVEPEEAARLKATGFVKPDDFVEPEEVQDGTLKITSEEGAQVTVAQTP